MKDLDLKDSDFELTDLQERFVDYFVGESLFNPIEAYNRAGYSKSGKPYIAAMRVLGSKAVIRAIHNRLSESSFWINEDAIVKQLWHEALTAKNDGARINALVWLGKHIGMWQDKKEDGTGNVTYNIVNYGVDKDEVVKTIEATPEVEKQKDKVQLPEGVAVLSYSKDKQT